MDGKTLLVSFQNNTEVIGLKYIHSYLCQHHIDSRVLFIPRYDEKDIPVIEEFIKQCRPKIIGISLMSIEYYNAKSFSVIIKNRFPEIIIVWGGIHPTISPGECLNYADYVFIGEAEQAILEFVNAIAKKEPVDNILNLGYKTSEGIHINKLRPLNENLDELPFPEYLPKNSSILHKGHIIELSKSVFKIYAIYSGGTYSLTTTRGCSFSCAYCCNSAFNKLYGKTQVRKRSVENVIAEMKSVIKLFPEIIYINIQDDNFFSYDIGWITAFAEAAEKDVERRFICRTTPAHLNEEKISALKKAGLAWIFMGLQSGSPRINKGIYKRYVTNDKFIEATKLVKKYGVAGYYDVILDNPYETERDVLETINVVLQIPKPFIPQLFSLCFYQGTEIHERALKENITIANPLSKNYRKFLPTFLNKVVRLCPILPKKGILWLINHRKSWRAKVLLNSIYLPSILIFETFNWFRLSLISVDYDISTTLRMILAFSKTRLDRIFSNR